MLELTRLLELPLNTSFVVRTGCGAFAALGITLSPLQTLSAVAGDDLLVSGAERSHCSCTEEQPGLLHGMEPACFTLTDTEHLQGGPEDVGLGKSATLETEIFMLFSFFSLAAPPAAAGPGGRFRGNQGQAALPQQGQISDFQLLTPCRISLYKGGMDIQEYGNSVVTVRYLQPQQLGEESRTALPRCVGMEIDGCWSHGLLWTGFFSLDRGRAGCRLETSFAPL